LDTIYKTLFQIDFYKESLSSEKKLTPIHSGIDIIPTAPSLAALTDLGLLFQTNKNGFAVFYSEQKTVLNEATLQELIKFRFHVYLNQWLQEEFAFPKKTNTIPEIYYLSNLKENIQTLGGKSHSLLHQNPQKSHASKMDQLKIRNSLFLYELESPDSLIDLTIKDFSGTIIFEKNVIKIDDKFRCFVDLTEQGTGKYQLEINGVPKEAFYIDSLLLAKSPYALLDIYHFQGLPEKYRFLDEQSNPSPKHYSAIFKQSTSVQTLNPDFYKSDSHHSDF